jgi:hypothetical protein
MSDRFESRRSGTVSEAEIGMLFERRAARADESGLAASVMASIADTRQTGGWRTWLPGSFGSLPTLVRVGALLMVAILAITVAFAAVGVSRPPREATGPTNAVRPSNLPTEPTNEVVRPSGVPSGLLNDGVRPSGPPTGVVDLIRHFEYTVPPGSKLSGPVMFGNTMVEWSSGSVAIDAEHPEAPHAVGVARGIIAASANTPWSHGNGRIRLRSVPAELLADLHDKAGVLLGPISESTLDGHPALVVDVRYPGVNDLHFRPQMEGLAGEDYIDLRLASRLIVVDVDGLTMLIDVWSRTPDDLATWLPTADAFIDSIHFLAPGETPQASKP